MRRPKKVINNQFTRLIEPKRVPLPLLLTDGELLLTAASISVEVVEEGGDALKCGLALTFDFNLEGDAGLADTTQVGYLVQLGHHAQTAAHGHSLTETHLVHAIVDEHLQVVDLDDLVPEVGQQREGKITMHDGALVGALGLGALYVYMYPLVVEGGIGKLIDAVLVDGKPLRGTNFLA